MNQISFLLILIQLLFRLSSGKIRVINTNGVSSNQNEIEHIPSEPLNPSEFELAKIFGEDNRHHGSEVYSKEIFRKHELESEVLRNGLIDSKYRWPKIGQYVIIPYLISTRFDQEKRVFILKAFENFHSTTCIRFVPRVNQNDYVFIVYGEGCDSDAGRVGGEQRLSLGKDCDYVDIAIHELNHAVGFWHEQNRPDRDSYINTYMENVIPENRFNFDKLAFSTINAFGQKYDTDSIMHYDKWAFSKAYGKLAVMLPKIPNPNMGLAKVLSKTDIAKINLMYKCSKSDSIIEQPHRNILLDNELNPPEMEGSCSNFHTNCTDFANHRNGCLNSWMKVNCRKACNICNNKCEDLRTECKIWSLKGACEEHPEYMISYCTKSCLKCKNIFITKK